MTISEIALFSFLALIAETIGPIGGFGSSLLFVPLASYFLDFYTVLGITALFHVMSNLSKIALFRKGVDKKIILQMGIPSVVFVILGAYLSKFVETRILQILLAIFLIVVSLLFLIFKKIKLNPTISNSVGGGILSGFTAGLLGTGGAIRGIVLASYNLKIEVFIATSAIIDLAIDFSRSIVYTLNGYVHTHDLYLIPILFVISILGTFLGKKILKKMSEEQFKSVVLVLVLFTGVITLVKVLMT